MTNGIRNILGQTCMNLEGVVWRKVSEPEETAVKGFKTEGLQLPKFPHLLDII